MGASFLWRPTTDKHYLDYGKNSRDDIAKALEEAFGGEPWRLSTKDIDVLRGMKAAGIEMATGLIELLTRHPEIEVWREW